MEVAYIQTPLGTAQIKGDATGICSVSVLDKEVKLSTSISDCLKPAVVQLQDYFKGNRQSFNLKLSPQGTPFQKKVWTALQQIPYGKTVSYLEISKTLGNEKAIRAVATANGKNPLWIVIPCHRVIGSDGSLTGYAGGLWRKKWLLQHERPSQQMQLFS